MKKLILLSFLLLCFAGSAVAEGVNALTLWMASGKQVSCFLSERPVVTFQGEDLVLTTHMNVVSYAAKDVLKFTYSYMEGDGIASLTGEATNFHFDGNKITAHKLDPESEVSVYSVDGILLATVKTDKSGSAVITIPVTAGNICVIKTSSATFKLHRL